MNVLSCIGKVAFFCAALVAVQAHLVVKPHLVDTGVSSRMRKDDKHGNYVFGYDIKDHKGATNSRAEMGDGHGNVKGSYSLADIDGRARKVEYVADKHGFRAVVKTNEPGTAKSEPAAALYLSPYGAPADKLIQHVAPVAVAPIVVKKHVGILAGPLGHDGYGYGNGYGMGGGYGNGDGYGMGGGYGLGLGMGY